MALVTNLSFADVNVETTADTKIGEDVFEINAGVVKLNVSLLTGDTYTTLADLSMAELFYKLHKYCFRAQETVNEAQAANEAETLKTFSAVTFGIPSAGGLVDVNLSQAVNLSLDDSAPVGIN